MSGKLFIKTHGCQMNEYDSAKMADVLGAAHGLELTRERGRSRRHPDQHLLDPRKGAGKSLQPARSLEGAETGEHRPSSSASAAAWRARKAKRSSSARRMSISCSVRRRCIGLPEMIEARRATGKPQVDISFPGNRKVRSPARAARRRSDRVRLDHGRLLEVLHVLRRALHARRGNQPAVRRRRRRDRDARRAGRARNHAARPERQCVSRADARRHRSRILAC